MAGWNDAETVIMTLADKYMAKVAQSPEGIPITLIKWRCEGLTEEQWETWRADPTVVAAAINAKLTRIELPDDEGHRVRLLKMKMPMLISDRSTLTTFYEHTKEDGTKVMMHSSKGNEDLVVTHKA